MNSKILILSILCLFICNIYGEVKESSYDTYYFKYWDSWGNYVDVGKSENEMLENSFIEKTVKWKSVWNNFYSCFIYPGITFIDSLDALTADDYDDAILLCSDYWNNGFENGEINRGDSVGYWLHDDKIDLFYITWDNTDFDTRIDITVNEDLFKNPEHTPGKYFCGEKYNYTGNNNQFIPDDGTLGIRINASNEFKRYYIWRYTDQVPTDSEDGEREGIDIKSVLFHEMGHLAGLAHSSNAGFVYGESVMYDTINCNASPLNTLHEYDCEAVRLNYGRNPSSGIKAHIKYINSITNNRRKK